LNVLKKIVGSLLLALATALPAHAQGLWEQPRYAAIVVDPSNGEVLYERRADLARHPASITKVMTLFLAFDALQHGTLRLADMVTITHDAARQPPSRLGLKAGQALPVEDAIRIIACKSANDIAVALADRLGGSESAFVAMMNAKAAQLGMAHTHFANASGLPNVNHYTTARDLATLSAALFAQHADRYAFFSQQEFAWRGRVMPNHNHLLGRVPGVDGIKTGYTASSGYTLAASAMRDGRRLIAIVLGSPTGALRDANVSNLLEAGFGVLRERVLGRRTTIAAALGEGTETAPGDPIGSLIAGWGRAPAAAFPPAAAAAARARPSIPGAATAQAD